MEVRVCSRSCLTITYKLIINVSFFSLSWHFAILALSSIMACPIVTRSTRQVRLVNRGCLLLLGTTMPPLSLWCFCLLCLQFVFRYMDFKTVDSLLLLSFLILKRLKKTYCYELLFCLLWPICSEIEGDICLYSLLVTIVAEVKCTYIKIWLI